MQTNLVKLVIISGRSGSGKSVALKVLEDIGYYCIDNLPVAFLSELVSMAKASYPKLAVSIDIRNIPSSSTMLDDIFDSIKKSDFVDSTLIYVDADDSVLTKRYLETRRLHPLSKHHLSLDEAITTEADKLTALAMRADLRIDTSNLSIHDLANEIRKLILGKVEKKLVIVFESFGFKNGIAKDADFVFDSRFLPNPFWEEPLREHTGLDPEVCEFFSRYKAVEKYIQQLDDLLMEHLGKIENSNRSYLTIAIGCTGGRHRSVYIANELYKRFLERGLAAQIRHRSLEKKD